MINDGYYHFCNDLDYYPDAVIYVVEHDICIPSHETDELGEFL